MSKEVSEEIVELLKSREEQSVKILATKRDLRELELKMTIKLGAIMATFIILSTSILGILIYLK